MTTYPTRVLEHFRNPRNQRRMTDADRHFTLLFYPQFLFNDDGEPLFAAERAKVRQPLAWLLGEQLEAACISGHLADEFYFEMRMIASLVSRSDRNSPGGPSGNVGMW